MPARLLLPILSAVLFLGGCARPGLLDVERGDFRAYGTPYGEPLPDSLTGQNPTFLVYGDPQPSWRAQTGFRDRRSWRTTRMFNPLYALRWFWTGLSGGVNYLRGQPDFGAEGRAFVRSALLQEAEGEGVLDERPDFALLLGDVTDDGRRPADWHLFLSEHLPLLQALPVLPVIGNHERANDTVHAFPNWEAVFARPRFYAEDFPDLSLLVLDTNLFLDQNHHLTEAEQEAFFREWFVAAPGGEPAWLERQLAERRDVAFKVVAMHHPPVSFGRHRANWASPTNQARRFRLLRLLRREGVQVVFTGHEHHYERVLVHSPSPATDEACPLHVIVASGGGAPIRPVAGPAEVERLEALFHRSGFDVEAAHLAERYHYVTAEVEGDRLVLRAVGVSEGGPEEVFDTVVIPAPPHAEGQACAGSRRGSQASP
jgi:hypothetical protein